MAQIHIYRIQDTTNEEYLNLYSSDNESAIVYTQDTFKISSGVDFLNQTPRLTIDSSGNATFAGDVNGSGTDNTLGGGRIQVQILYKRKQRNFKRKCNNQISS